MTPRDIRQRLDERRAAVQAFGALYAWLLGLADDFLIEFEQGFDVVGREGDGDEN